MPKQQSIQARLEVVRPPRVRLSYDVQVGDAIERKELPFVVGVVGDFGGCRVDAPRPRLKDRRFVQVDLDSFDDVMRGVAPRAAFRVPNRLGADGGEFAIDLRFDRFDDFRPESVVEQVEPLRRLLALRERLSDLRNKMAGNDRLEDLLADALRGPETLAALGHEGARGAEPA
ncbi:MAG: type VI secretion system contractile sheath small subunit [Comamonadaceae bacterium]|nr:type VI secretion system contractile sheath small subunit [Comamonadaceae bacterium]